jgi:hypothetical protein
MWRLLRLSRLWSKTRKTCETSKTHDKTSKKAEIKTANETKEKI